MLQDLIVDKAAFVMALVEVIKSIDDKNKLEKWLPLIALVVGLGVSAVITQDLLIVWRKWLINGLIYGLMAMGFYSGTKAIKERNK